MSHSHAAGFLVSGAIFVGIGGVFALAPAGAAVTPTTPLPTTPSQSQWTDTAFPVPAGVSGTAQLAVSTSDREIADWTVGPKAGGNWRSGIAMLRRGKHLLGATTVPWSVAATPAITKSGQGLVLGTARGAIDTDGLGWATVSAGGKVSALHALTGASLAGGQAVSLSMNAKGAAVAAWIQGTGDTATLRAALRADEHHAFRKPFTVSTAHATEVSGVSTAIDASGHAVVVYGERPAGTSSAARVVRASIGLASNPSLGDVGEVGPQDGHARTTVTFASGGRVDVAWGSQPAGEEADGPYVVRTASLGRTAGAFTKPTVIDPGAGHIAPVGPLQIVPGPGSSTLLAWSGVGANGTFPVKVAQTNPFGQFGAPQTLSTSAVLGGAAVDPGGFAVVSLSPYSPADDTDDADLSAGTVVASLRLPGRGAFSAPGPVSPLVRDHSDFSEPLAQAKPAVVISPQLLLDEARAMVARVVVGPTGASSLVLSQSFEGVLG